MDKKKKGLKVLIVDDQESVREVLSYAIQGRGFISEDARNGKEALEKVAQGRPDIIILDLAMPEMDGLQTCKQLRENPCTRNIPVIFLSAQRDPDKLIPGLPGAVIKCIAKPCDIEYLIHSAAFKPRPLGRGRITPLSVSILSKPRSLDRGVEGLIKQIDNCTTAHLKSIFPKSPQ